MENPTVAVLRSRSRSKTPFLRSSCDRERCAEDEEHVHDKSGRKTTVKRSTPIRQMQQSRRRESVELIEEDPKIVSPPAHRTRQSSRTVEKLVKTSDYSSEESLDRLQARRKEIFQNEINSQYERVSTSTKRYSLEDLPYSPIHSTHNVTKDRSSRFGSPAYSACSTDSSFAEQALADASALLEREHSSEHLPYRLYKMAGEYWNKYPKTDYTYSRMSRDRVELAPGLVAVPNMSRRSLAQFRVQGPNTDVTDVSEHVASTAAWTTSTAKKRFAGIDSSDDEMVYNHRVPTNAHKRWLITRLLIAMITTITTATGNTYRKIVSPSHRYPYTERRPVRASLLSRAGSMLSAPFYWMYTLVKTIVTTTVTTVTETITPNHAGEHEVYKARGYQSAVRSKPRMWPWLLMLLLPIVGYGLNYTYENYDHLAMPNFTNFGLDLSEFYALEFPNISLPELPNYTLSDFNPFGGINLTLPQINVTLPEINIPVVAEKMPVVSKVYREYKNIVQNRMTDASDYLSVVARSCYEEMRRFWGGFIG